METRYQYETSPRKLEPDYRREKKKQNIKVVKDLPKQDVKLSKEQKRKHRKATLLVIAIFAVLFTISYRNTQINEKFNEIQTLRTELSSLQKENEQLQVTIENSLNLSNIEIEDLGLKIDKTVNMSRPTIENWHIPYAINNNEFIPTEY